MAQNPKKRDFKKLDFSLNALRVVREATEEKNPLQPPKGMFHTTASAPPPKETTMHAMASASPPRKRKKSK